MHYFRKITLTQNEHVIYIYIIFSFKLLDKYIILSISERMYTYNSKSTSLIHTQTPYLSHAQNRCSSYPTLINLILFIIFFFVVHFRVFGNERFSTHCYRHRFPSSFDRLIYAHSFFLKVLQISMFFYYLFIWAFLRVKKGRG